MANFPQLNLVFLETVLRRAQQERAVRRILEVSSVPAVAHGENYCGIIHRAELKVLLYSGDTDVVKVIVKVAPDDKARAKIIQEFGSFRVEMLMYNKVLADMERLMITRGDWRDTIWCRCYAVHPYDTLILEDLKYKGYVTGDRIKGLDLEHAEVVVKALARFHAMSKVLYDNDQLDISQFGECFFARKDNEFITQFTTSSIRAFAKVVETSWSPEWKETSERLMKAADTITERLANLLKRDDNAFNVLNHGDPWTTNIMFQYDQYTSKITGVKYIDYQFPHFNTPVVDLIFFIYSSLRIDHITSHTIHRLLTKYHEELLTTFTVLHHEVDKVPSVDELIHKMDDKFGMCVVLSMLLLPLMISKVGIDINAATRDTSTGYASEVYQHRPYIETMQILLPQFVERGLI